jgi:hypothetical protein
VDFWEVPSCACWSKCLGERHFCACFACLVLRFDFVLLRALLASFVGAVNLPSSCLSCFVIVIISLFSSSLMDSTFNNRGGSSAHVQIRFFQHRLYGRCKVCYCTYVFVLKASDGFLQRKKSDKDLTERDLLKSVPFLRLRESFQ